MEQRRVRVTNHMSASEAIRYIWRPGRSIGRTIYAQLLSSPHDNDVLLGMVDFPDLARHICDVHNKFLMEQGNKHPNIFIAVENKMQHTCKRCGTDKSEMWWKCCPRHTSERGDDVMCDNCKDEMHPLGV